MFNKKRTPIFGVYPEEPLDADLGMPRYSWGDQTNGARGVPSAVSDGNLPPWECSLRRYAAATVAENLAGLFIASI